MKIQEGTLTAALGLAVLLGAEAGRAQAPVLPSRKPPSAGGTLRDAKTLGDAKAAAAALESAYQGETPPEAVRMLVAILRGSQLGPGEGWFGPAQSRFSWEGLARRCQVDPAQGAISRDRFPGSEAWFASLDRNKDGRITPDELDWSSRNSYVQQSYLVNRFFRRLNSQGNGRLTREELLKFFDKAAQGRDYLTSDELRDALLGGVARGFTRGDAPTMAVLIRGLFAGDIGSMCEGPQLDRQAPNFSLKTVDGKSTVELAKLYDSKPVVLVFGNFTCGPFRSFYPDVEAVYQRYQHEAHFLMVYVREAHPTDGWKMESNTSVGVAAKQPTNFQERAGVAGQFCARLKPTLPVVVDDIGDAVGHAYSGMPARLYVLDRKGRVAYKGGRGPFGFSAGEMEQALVMTLMEDGTAAGRPDARIKVTPVRKPALGSAAPASQGVR